MSTIKKPNCYECKYRGTVPGDAHSCCKWGDNDTSLFGMFSPQNLANRKKLEITAIQHGIDKGWFMWPVNFDPTWLLNCEGFEEITDKEHHQYY